MLKKVKKRRNFPLFFAVLHFISRSRNLRDNFTFCINCLLKICSLIFKLSSYSWYHLSLDIYTKNRAKCFVALFQLSEFMPTNSTKYIKKNKFATIVSRSQVKNHYITLSRMNGPSSQWIVRKTFAHSHREPIMKPLNKRLENNRITIEWSALEAEPREWKKKKHKMMIIREVKIRYRIINLNNRGSSQR